MMAPRPANGIEFLLGTNPKIAFASGSYSFVELVPERSGSELLSKFTFSLAQEPEAMPVIVFTPVRIS